MYRGATGTMQFGYSVALGRNQAIIGSLRDATIDPNADGHGAAYFFTTLPTCSHYVPGCP